MGFLLKGCEARMSQITWIIDNYQTILTGVNAILAGLITISMAIPGPEPERTLQKIADFLARFSKK